MHATFYVIYLIIMTAYVSCQSVTDSTNLYTALMTGYQKHSRPGTDYNLPLIVNFTFNIVAIKDFDEVLSRFAVAGFFTLNWVDERLDWNPSTYNNLYYTLLQQKEVWKPSLILGNPYTSIKFLGSDDFYIRYDFSGHATWNPGDIYEVVCDADVTYYPFDQQKCVLKYSPWFILLQEVYFNSLETTINTEMYSPHSLWDLKSTKVEVNDNGYTQFVDLSLVFKRRPAFYVVNMILPMVMMCFINGFVFVLPPDSGERVGFSITVLLSIAVFLTILTDALPQASQPQISILCYLLIAQMSISIFVMILTILSLRFYLSDEPEESAKKYTTFVNIVLCKWRCKKKMKPPLTFVTPQESEAQQQPPKKNEKSRNKINPDISNTTIPLGSNLAQAMQEDDNTVDMTWKTVGKAFDKVSLLSVVAVSFIVNVSFLSYLLHDTQSNS